MGSLAPSSIIGGKYRLVRPLGRGGMGEVWIAENVILEKRVALKVVLEDAAACPLAVERFLREAVTASRVHHPAIVEVYDAGADAGTPWIAMELLEGESLADRITRRVLSVDDVMLLLLPIIEALGALHAVGIIHRDLKPDNIFLEASADGTTRAKLLDFGIAKSVAVSALTKTGELIGTGHYLSPEQARGARDIDARSDIFSMGVVLFEALSGRTPYEAETLPELIAKLFTEPPRSLTRLQPSVPEGIAQVVHRCLERAPAARPHDAARLASLLRGAHAVSLVSAAEPPKPAPVALARTLAMADSPPKPRRPLRVARDALAIVAALVFAVAIFVSSAAALAHLQQARSQVHSTIAPRAEASTPPPPTSAPRVVSTPPHAGSLPVNAAVVPRVTDAVAAPAVVAASPHRVQFRTGELDVSGGLTREQVRGRLRALRPLAACVDSASRLPLIDGARFVVEFTVSTHGTVRTARLVSSGLDDDWQLERCAVDAIAEAQFAEVPATTFVTYPFIVEPRVSARPHRRDPLAGLGP